MIEHRSDCPVAQGAPSEECSCLELTPIQSARVVWEIPRNVWTVLVMWGLSVVVLAGLFAWWQGREAANERQHNREQDRAMCELVTALQGGPTPPPGPAGDRARELIPKIEAVRRSTCDEEAPG